MMPKTLFKGFTKGKALQLFVAIVAALAFSLVLGFFSSWPNLLITVGMTVVFSIVLGGLIDKHDANLTKRMEAVTPNSWAREGRAAGMQPSDWEVWMNDVLIGTVTDSEYAAMQRHAARDIRNAIAQLLNIGRVALVILDKVLVAVPLFIFWAAIAFAVFSPDSLTETVREFLSAGPTAIAGAIQSFLQVGLSIAVLTFLFMPVLGFRFGFKNVYEAAVNQMLRQHCKTPVDGDIRLVQAVSSCVVANS